MICKNVSVAITADRLGASVLQDNSRIAIGVLKYGYSVGRILFDPADETFHTEMGVPISVFSDIKMTYYRDNVLFGESGDGYRWVEETFPIDMADQN